MQINQLEKVEVISQADYFNTYKQVKYRGSYVKGGVWNDDNFKNALVLAKENPNSWILFNKFQCTEGIYAQKYHERNRLRDWFRVYKQKNMLHKYFLEIRQKDNFEFAYLSYQELEEE
tara:strand:- start:360 stop:713 length:354 start_codon:yes stop_codon:yes gene_type:complete